MILAVVEEAEKLPRGVGSSHVVSVVLARARFELMLELEVLGKDWYWET